MTPTHQPRNARTGKEMKGNTMKTNKSEEFLAKYLKAARDHLWALSMRRRTPFAVRGKCVILDADDLRLVGKACDEATNALACWEEANNVPLGEVSSAVKPQDEQDRRNTMKERKHTPGPWRAVGPSGNDGEAEVIKTANGSRSIGWTSNTYDAAKPAGDVESTTEEDRANGRLWATAPDLLDACIQVLTASEDGGGMEDIDWDGLRAAVKSAV